MRIFMREFRFPPFLLVFLCFLTLTSCKNRKEVKRETVSDFTVATFEYIENDGYKLITSEIDSLDTFDSLMLKQSDMDFDGEWIYRITFNPGDYAKNAKEFAVLFGSKCVSINGTVYVADGCSYSDILNWAANKYEYFDYALITE